MKYVKSCVKSLSAKNSYLKKQYEADPLVVSVVFVGIFVTKIVGYTRMCYFYADLTEKKIS